MPPPPWSLRLTSQERLEKKKEIPRILKLIKSSSFLTHFCVCPTLSNARLHSSTFASQKLEFWLKRKLFPSVSSQRLPESYALKVLPPAWREPISFRTPRFVTMQNGSLASVCVMGSQLVPLMHRTVIFGDHINMWSPNRITVFVCTSISCFVFKPKANWCLVMKKTNSLRQTKRKAYRTSTHPATLVIHIHVVVFLWCSVPRYYGFLGPRKRYCHDSSNPQLWRVTTPANLCLVPPATVVVPTIRNLDAIADTLCLVSRAIVAIPTICYFAVFPRRHSPPGFTSTCVSFWRTRTSRKWPHSTTWTCTCSSPSL